MKIHLSFYMFLKQISEDIHEQRKLGSMTREPGVGAEDQTLHDEQADYEAKHVSLTMIVPY